MSTTCRWPAATAAVLLVAGVLLVGTPATAQQPRTPDDRPSPAATADPASRRGVAIDLAAIDVNDELVPGDRYRLPPLRITNPGAAPTDYQMAARPGGDGQPPPANWVAFTPAEFSLPAGSEQLVQVELVLPPGAVDGHYTGLLAAQIVQPSDDGQATGATVGAAAGARLAFDVVPASWWQGWFNAIRRWFTDNAPWSYIAVGIATALLLLWLLSRRYRFRLERVTPG